MNTGVDADGGGCLAVIAGSGLGGLESCLRERLGGLVSFAERVPFGDIEGVGQSTVAGHEGAVLWGRLGGAAPRSLALVLGRRHLYEGGRLGMPALIRWLSDRGIKKLVAVSAAGAVNRALQPGQLIIIKDIIDMQNRDYLQPHLRRSFGRDRPRPASGLGRLRLSPQLTRVLEAAGRRVRVPLARGTLASGAGPAYETSAEVRLLQSIGADVASMSAAPEVQYAAEAGIAVAVVAVVTNTATGVGTHPPNHQNVLAAAASTIEPLGAILAETAAGA